MGKITIGTRSFETPVLVPSISSFETQLQPPDALRLQLGLQEPISLISAYDVYRSKDELVRLCHEYRNHGIMLMDSGGYESSRIFKHIPGGHSDWDFERFAEVSSLDIYDFIFSFDYFIQNNEAVLDFTKRITQEFHNHATFVDATKLIPVVHVQSFDGLRQSSVVFFFLGGWRDDV
jgi:hypothetical protein